MIYICTVVFFHYSFANQVTRIFLQTFEEGCRTLVFFLTMNFYIKMCSKLLKRREVWLKAFRVLWNISLTLFVAVETWVVIAVTQKRVNDNNLCNNSTYLTMQISNFIIILAFLTLGFFVDKRVQEQRAAENQYEEAFRKKTQIKSLKNL